MAKGEIEQKAKLSRQEAARWLAELATAIGEGGTVEVALSGSPVTLHLAEEMEVELELEPYGDKIELEIEFTWRAPRSEQAAPHDRPFARSTRG